MIPAVRATVHGHGPRNAWCGLWVTRQEAVTRVFDGTCARCLVGTLASRVRSIQVRRPSCRRGHSPAARDLEPPARDSALRMRCQRVRRHDRAVPTGNHPGIRRSVLNATKVLHVEIRAILDTRWVRPGLEARLTQAGAPWHWGTTLLIRRHDPNSHVGLIREPDPATAAEPVNCVRSQPSASSEFPRIDRSKPRKSFSIDPRQFGKSRPAQSKSQRWPTIVPACRLAGEHNVNAHEVRAELCQQSLVRGYSDLEIRPSTFGATGPWAAMYSASTSARSGP